jgi:uncharacterized protein (DUF1501 family)
MIDPRQNRRNFIKTAGAATLGALTGTAPGAEKPPKIKPTADTCILLWMAGGMAAPDTFDPKRYEPYKEGLDVNRILSTFPAIDTAVDNIKLTKGLENIAKVMDRGTLIRSHVLPDLGNILHSRHQYHWHTGYVPPVTVAAPHMGAWMAQALGPRNPAIPAFIDIGQRFNSGEREELKAFHTAGFLGSEYGPFLVPEPKDAIQTVRPPKGMSRQRFQRRYEAYRKMVKASRAFEATDDFQRESLLRSIDNAYRLLDSPAAKAFDLELEPKASFAKYNTGRFGQGCLLARRLTEAGARFIEVTSEYVPFVYWDTHENGHTTVAKLKSQIDRPIAQLVLDLEERGLLDRTLIVLASEFSRDMIIEGVPGSSARDQSRAKTDVIKEMKQYGLHRHFTGASSVLMFGGGVKKGSLYGRSAPERPCLAIEKPISVEDLHATIYTAMGISPKYNQKIERRPFYVTNNGEGKAVHELIA